MLDVIDFLERMGGDARLSQASPDELATALAAVDATSEQHAALVARDAERLGELLGSKPVCVLVAPPGPPGTGPQPARPAVPPPSPGKEAEEDEDLTNDSERSRLVEYEASGRTVSFA